jgi:hypothetical protein
MTRRCLLSALTFALLVTPSPAQLLGRSDFLFTGILDRFPDREGRIAARGRNGELYTLRAQGARVEVGNRGPGTWEDLRPGAIVDVYGQWRGRREAVVTRLQLVGRETGVPPREAIRDWREGSRRELTGRVTAVDREREALRVRVGEQIVPVELFDRTRFLRGGRQVSPREVRVGARVRARGEVRSGRLLAEEIVLLDDSAAPDARVAGARSELGETPDARTVTGTVLSLDAARRRMRVRTRTREYVFQIAGARVTLEGREVSREEIRPGDVVQVRARDREETRVAEEVVIIAE